MGEAAALRVHPDLDTNSTRVVTRSGVVDVNGAQWRAQRPYPNGVVVHTNSGWLGNGFGSSTAKIAVRAGVIVGVYENEQYHAAARVVGTVGNITADRVVAGNGATRRSWVTKTALSKWIAAVKALPAEEPRHEQRPGHPGHKETP